MKKYAITLLVASGLLIGCQQSVQTASEKFNQLPPAVQKTARAQAPNAEITDVSQFSTNGMTAYQIEFREQGGANPKIVVAQNGTLLGGDVTKPAGMLDKLLTPTGAAGTPFSALPLAVQKTIQQQAPNRAIDSITRHDENGTVVYEVKFKDQGANPSIKVASDGTLVQNLQK